MKKRALIWVLLGLLLVGCTEEELDMTVVTKTMYQNETITGIDVSDAWNVTLVNDSVSYVELEYSAFLEEYINATYNATTGVFTLGRKNTIHLPYNTVMNATIHVDQLHNLKLSDATVCRGGHFTQMESIEIDDASELVDIIVEGSSFSIKVSDASVFKGSLTSTDTLELDLSDASEMVTYGTSANYVKATVSNASTLNMLNTETQTMDIEVSDASEASVFVTGLLQGHINDASDLYYKGNPTINVDCTDASEIHPL